MSAAERPKSESSSADTDYEFELKALSDCVTDMLEDLDQYTSPMPDPPVPESGVAVQPGSTGRVTQGHLLAPPGQLRGGETISNGSAGGHHLSGPELYPSSTGDLQELAVQHPLTARDVAADIRYTPAGSMRSCNSAGNAPGNLPEDNITPEAAFSLLHPKLHLNVGGKHFVTFRTTLQRFQFTRLARLNEFDPSYDFTTGEFFFDRSPKIFSSIMDWYRTGVLHFSHCLCGPVIKAELDFWEIDDCHIAPCCWRAYKAYEDEQSTLAVLDVALSGDQCRDADEDDSNDGCSCSLCPGINRQHWQARIWSFLDKPQSSRPAQIWALFIFILIMLSIAVIAMQTHPYFRVAYAENRTLSRNFTNPKEEIFYTTQAHPIIQYIETGCLFIFCVELILRFYASPAKCKFFRSIFNIIDVFCVGPALVVYVIEQVDPTFWETRQFIFVISYLSLTSVLRVFRLFKLARHYKGLKILQLAVRSSLRELLLLCMLIFMGMLVFSTLIYFAEFEVEDNFEHIPIGFWWSIVTMTTVGYGDIYPRSGWGYIVGSLCAISGMLATGLPIPIIASNFNHYYNFARYKDKLADRKILNRNMVSRHKSLAGGSLVSGLNRNDPYHHSQAASPKISCISNKVTPT